MHRFFVEPGTVSGERLALPAAIAHQVTRVLRLHDGERIVLLQNDGREAVCRLDGDDLVVEVRRAAGGEPRHRLTVCQALLKGDALEGVIRHGTEIGIARFRLFVSERCVARDLSPRRVERLRTIAREAAEQSERGMMPAIIGPVRLAEVLGPAAVVLYERHDGERLSAIPPPAEIIIGPEGGFSTGEIAAAREAGSVVVGLGPRILRSETVAVAAASVILSRAGDFA